jgi:hypothetical protein
LVVEVERDDEKLDTGLLCASGVAVEEKRTAATRRAQRSASERELLPGTCLLGETPGR